MSDLLARVLSAYGGAERWKKLNKISAHQRFGGVLWPLKQVGGIVDDARFTVAIQKQWTSITPFTGPDRRSVFTPTRVAIESTSKGVLEELHDPRASFAGHTLETPWNPLQLAYFTGYAMWTYVTEPYSFTFPGVQTEELEPWNEQGEKWRRLKVTYPGSIATHNAEQTLYVDSDGLLRRRDYQVDIAGGVPSVQYMSGHREISGIVIPTTRMIYGRDAQNRAVPEPLVVSIELDDITVD
ncbi:hypothetical protein [Cystobacter ferrugineus]|uniref:Uncharacterized protein n=1 Tax=Cystobacter ferrugineus TaxID=83449 RepID=A0A1L9AZ05_9BACT|nr:hypothetical protein [Cystobacter ferrugineus]OJH35206.1 hypothetical protein BON30_39820 [Cystobacter ferrugineus]